MSGELATANIASLYEVLCHEDPTVEPELLPTVVLKRHSLDPIALRFGVPDELSLDFAAFEGLFQQ